MSKVYDIHVPVLTDHVLYYVCSFKGVIEGQQSLNIPLTIKALAIGHITVNCAFRILGSTSPPIQVEIHCTGEGPVISVIPAQLDWGPSPVLTPIDRKLLLSNESEIQAEFNTAFVRIRKYLNFHF